MSKRTEQDSSSNKADSEEDVGPMPATESIKKKKRKVLEHESTFLENLPCADLYERSLMHRDHVNFVYFTKTDFLITTSVDGHVKFWKKTQKGIEFVKHFRAHLGAVVAMSVSPDGSLFATAGSDKALKIFDIVNFDMINMVKTTYLPLSICWVYQKSQAQAMLACSEKESANIHIYDGRSSSNDPIFTITKLHKSPVIIMQYNPNVDVVVSVDEGGMIEYWEYDKSNTEVGFNQPGSQKIEWKYKSDTDLYEYKKSKTCPASLSFSPDYSKFSTIGFEDRQIRIFKFSSGKLLRKYDESLTVISEMQHAGTSVYQVDDMEFGRRLAQDREIERSKGGQSSTINAIFDASGNFIIYSTLLGIKIVNIVTNKVVRLLGRTESIRPLNITLYQGAPHKKNVTTVAMAASDNPTLKESDTTDPSIICTGFKRNRFYIFSRREPDSTDSSNGRDLYNEKPSKEEQTVAQMSQSLKSLGSIAVLHTTVGDIKIKLFPEFAPKAVENFVGLARKGYYDGVIFHRVIRNFMIQTGDPLGDGTGGSSLWGHDFEDEFSTSVKHDRPYTVSMANCGPNTNASQFFITTTATPWLDNKHTIFGRAIDGFEAIHVIESAKVMRLDKPRVDIKIVSVEIS